MRVDFHIGDKTRHTVEEELRYLAWSYGYRLPNKVEPLYYFSNLSKSWVWKFSQSLNETVRDESLTYAP